LSEDERPAAREKVTTEMRQKITAILTPEQKPKYQQIIAAQQQARAAGSPPAANPANPSNPATPTTENTTKSIAAQANNTPATPKKEVEKPAMPSNSTAPAVAGAAAGVAAGSAAALSANSAPAILPSLPAGSAAGDGGGNPATQFRNLMVAQLALTPAQIEKVDAIYADARPKFMSMRDLPQEERSKAREKITAEIRAQLRDQMTAEQKPKFDALVAAAASRQVTRGKIYLLGADGKPKAYNVRLGITDGSSTELIVSNNPANPTNSADAAELVEGAAVIIGTVNTGATVGSGGTSGQRPAGATGPRMAF
jgi:HlyD family secretion protein